MNDDQSLAPKPAAAMLTGIAAAIQIPYLRSPVNAVIMVVLILLMLMFMADLRKSTRVKP